MLSGFLALNTRKKVLLGSLLPLISLIATTGVMLVILDNLRSTSRWVADTQTVLDEADNIVAAAVDMETGMRGYLLAGRDQFLGPYSAGAEIAFSNIEALQQVVSDNGAQVERLAEADRILRDWQMEAAEPAISLRQEIGDSQTMNDVAALIREEHGRVYFEQFRSQIAEFIARETALLQERQAASDDARATLNDSLATSDEATAVVDETHRVIERASTILIHTLSIETGVHGYILTGDRAFLESYEQSQQTFFALASSLRDMVGENAGHVNRITVMEEDLRQWIEEVAEPGIAIRQQVSRRLRAPEDLDDFVAEGLGRDVFERARENIDSIITAERSMLYGRISTAESASESIQTNLSTLEANEGLAQYTYEVIEQANAILTAAVDMETGMRGYLLAGRDSFLEPYAAGQEAFSQLVIALQERVSDNPEQVALLDGIATTISDWQDGVVEPMIALRREIGEAATMDNMADLIAEERGRIFFDQFRAVMGEFENVAQGQMSARQAESDDTSDLAIIALLGCLAVGLATGGGIGALVGNGIANPVKRLTRSMGILADGDTTVSIPGTRRSDELGDMAKAVQVFKDNMIHADEMAEQAAASQQQKEERAKRMDELTRAFDQEVSETIAAVASSSDQMTNTANSLTNIADQASERAAVVAGVSEEAKMSVQSVASAAEELNASVQEIALQVHGQTEMARNASTTASVTDEQVNRLDKAAREIGEVIQLINAIAEQTNLLALNATIEAARAGDAGKGFAVVASEVKNLASQTSKATDTISEQVSQIQSTTTETVSSIREIIQQIEKMNEISRAVAAAVEEQNASTQEISRNAQGAATGTSEVSENIVGVTGAAQETGRSATEVLGVAQELSGRSTSLRRVVETFLENIKAA